MTEEERRADNGGRMPGGGRRKGERIVLPQSLLRQGFAGRGRRGRGGMAFS